MHRVVADASDPKQPLLHKNQARASCDTPVANQALKDNRNLTPQQNAGATRYFVSNRMEQLRAGLGDVAAEDENLRIEDVQNADHGGSQGLQGAVKDAASALVSFRGRAKNSLRAVGLTSLAGRQLRGCRSVNVSQIIRFDGSGRKMRFHAAVVPADAKTTVEIESHVPKMARRSRGPAKHSAIHQHSSANAGPKSQQDHITFSTGSSPEHFRKQRGPSVVVGKNR